MQDPNIPLELLLDVADDLLDDKPTLQNLALTSKIIYNYCQPLIYRSVNLRIIEPNEYSSGATLNRFAHVFTDRERASYLRDLRLQFCGFEGGVDEVLATHLELFGNFENLEMLHICAASPMDIYFLDTDGSPTVWNGLFDAIGRTVKFLRIENIRFASFEQLANILSKFPNLQVLALRLITFSSIPPDAAGHQYSLKAPIPLQTLHIESCQALDTIAKYLNLVTTNNVENFGLSVQLHGDLTGIHSLCRSVAHSVKHITFDAVPSTMFHPRCWSQELEKIFEKAAFAEMPHLETFTFGHFDLDDIAAQIRFTPRTVIAYGVYLARFLSSWIPTVISSVDGTRLHTVNFRFRMQDPPRTEKILLRRIDLMPSDMGRFPCLDRVNVQPCTQKRPGTRFSHSERLSRSLFSGLMEVDETMIPANLDMDALLSRGENPPDDLLTSIHVEDFAEDEDEFEDEDERDNDENRYVHFGPKEEFFGRHGAQYEQLSTV
ncbi:hypothetical protein K474DRAFT_1156316 [Panus rudis PR-1116 ss-1]|nr:hypothetical protein K474DRAFT_1156316 [Panus rudis PR-1116 ss-1]